MTGEEDEKTKWTVGVGMGPSGFSAFVSREVERLKKLTEKPKRPLFMGKGKQSDIDSRDQELREQELRDEFRAFLQQTRDNVDLYLWFALANLAERNVERKYESKVFGLFGHVASTFLYIQQNFDPSVVTSDLLSFLKDRITRIGSPGAFEVQGRASAITQSGEGGRVFLESVTFLEKLLAEVRQDLSKYFKKDEAFEATAKAAMK